MLFAGLFMQIFFFNECTGCASFADTTMICCKWAVILTKVPSNKTALIFWRKDQHENGGDFFSKPLVVGELEPVPVYVQQMESYLVSNQSITGFDWYHFVIFLLFLLSSSHTSTEVMHPGLLLSFQVALVHLIAMNGRAHTATVREFTLRFSLTKTVTPFVYKPLSALLRAARWSSG